MARTVRLFLPVLFVLCSLWAHAQISQSERTSMLSLLQRAGSERLAIERHLKTIETELTVLRETQEQLSNEHDTQRRLWIEQRESSESRIELLESQKAELERLLGQPGDWESSWESLSSEFEDFRSAAAKGQRSALLKGVAIGAGVTLIGGSVFILTR